jgi:small subunit ribosomal protein S9
MARKKTKRNFTSSVGRRKSSTARVRLFKGKKENLVNDQLIGKYFPGPVMREAWEKPFALTDTKETYYITAKVKGGGKKGQLEAVVLATARALNETNREKFRPSLKKAGLLTCDSRRRQRRMVGTGGRARKQKQSPKR